MSAYEEFAQIYDTLMDDFDYLKWVDYIEAIFDWQGIQPRNILEMACGTGSLSMELLKKGYKLDAFDLSEDMLARASKKLMGNRKLRLFKMDMTEFSLDATYNAVISACDSINYILSEDKLLQTFRNVFKHLEPNGLFIFDINSKFKLMNILGNNIFLEDRDDIFYTWDNRYDENTDICTFYLTFFYSIGKKYYSRFDEIHTQRAYSKDRIIELLKEAGFTKVDHFEAFRFNRPTLKTERINFVAKK